VTAVPDALLAAERVPHVAPLQPAPDRAQVTPLPALSLVTVAVNGWLCPTCADIVAGETATEIGAATPATSWFEPPPQPDSNPSVVIVNANKDCAACPACSRIKAVSLSVGVFGDLRLRGGWKLRLLDTSFKPVLPCSGLNRYKRPVSLNNATKGRSKTPVETPTALSMLVSGKRRRGRPEPVDCRVILRGT
jgi:hypothetical protein